MAGIPGPERAPTRVRPVWTRLPLFLALALVALATVWTAPRPATHEAHLRGAAPAALVRAASAPAAVVSPAYLGNPFTARPIFSRNVWDMQAFANRVYLGHGDFISNTGSVPIFYFDPALQQIVADPVFSALTPDCPITGTGNYCVDDEEITSFRVIDNKLYLPGIDGTEQWNQHGNLYVREAAATGWAKYRTVPLALHVYDLYKFPDPLSPALPPRLIAGIGAYGPDPVPISRDDGQSVEGWSTSTVNWPAELYTPIIRLFNLGGRLYGSAQAHRNNLLVRYDGGDTFNFVPFAEANQMFPDKLDVTGTPTINVRVFRELNLGSQLVYLGVTGFQQIPFGLYRATEVTQAQPIALPVAGLAPMDLLLGADGLAYVLGQTGAAGSYTNYVFASADLANWSEVLRFPAATFARSFEYLGGYWYFGLGTTRQELSAASGELWRVYDPRLPSLPTATPTRTRTPTATPTPTRTATPSPTASLMPLPAPNVGVTVQAAGAGRLSVSLAARSAGCAASNELRELRFGDDPRVYRNAAIELDGAVRQPPFTVTLPPGTATKTFAVIQLAAGSDATVPVIVRDACGLWTTLVGGGAAVFQAPRASQADAGPGPAAPAVAPVSPTPVRTPTPGLP
jgi:hypothetical protein